MKLRTSILTAVLLVGVSAPAHADTLLDSSSGQYGFDTGQCLQWNFHNLTAYNACMAAAETNERLRNIEDALTQSAPSYVAPANPLPAPTCDAACMQRAIDSGME
jgi:hypothetical protein